MKSSSESIVLAYAGNSARVVSARALSAVTDSTHRTTVLLCTPGGHGKSQNHLPTETVLTNLLGLAREGKDDILEGKLVLSPC